ncbi:MAG: marine proteobacterial sortase target protein [Halioglobus sp.]|nr:marine proteobacterial sortase target protein [Halioglobus sp.]
MAYKMYFCHRYAHAAAGCSRPLLRLFIRCLPALLLGAVWLLLLSAGTAAAAAAASHEETGPNGVGSGHLLLQDDTTGRFIPALVHHSKVHFDINGMIAIVQVEQTFRNVTDRYLEGVYVFPLPGDAAVRAMELQLGERRIVGVIEERAQARKIYEAAKTAGNKAGLVEQQRPNLFTNRVANIAPGEEVTVQLEYVQAVSYEAEVFSLRFPMTITPRYIPGTPVVDDVALEAGAAPLRVNSALGWATPTDRVPDADAISPFLHPAPGSDPTPLNPIEITAELDMGMPLARVDSAYHDIALSRRAGVYSLALVNGVSEMDRDFVLSWQPVGGSAPQAAVFTEKVGDDYYALLMVVPPTAQRRAVTIPREIVFVVDTSGSMGGVAIEQARASVASALGQLRPQDYFNIIEFNSSHRALYAGPVPATADNVRRAQALVQSLIASGGTEMLPALRAALSQAGDGREVERLRQVIFITDGAVGNEEELLEELSSRLGDSRLFTVGIGSAPNAWFMRKAAEFGRGTHTPIGALDEVGSGMAALFEQLSRPAAVDFAIDWGGSVDAWPQRVPDLYQGQVLSVAANFGPALPTGTITVSGRVNGRPWQQQLQLMNELQLENAGAHAGVASIWARRKIAGLLDQKRAGRDEAAVRAAVLPLALAHRLLSPYTSFVAVEEIVSRPAGDALDSAAVPNTRPRGQSPQQFAYPRTATSGPAKLWFGIFCLFLAMVVRVLSILEVDHVPAEKE